MHLVDQLLHGSEIFEEFAVEPVIRGVGGVEAHAALFEDDDAGGFVGVLDHESICHLGSPIGSRTTRGGAGTQPLQRPGRNLLHRERFGISVTTADGPAKMLKT